MSTTSHKILDHGDLPEGRVTTVTVGHHTLAVTNHEGTYGCLDNHCPHQGGPLGEGSIEEGHLRCPWHGYDFDPTTGTPPGPFNDGPPCYQVEVREDGIYATLPDEPARERTVSDAMVETMVAWGIDTVFGIVGHSNLGFGDAMRLAEVRGDLAYYGVRHEGAAAFAASAYGKLTGRPAACFGIAGPGSTNLLTGLYDAKVDRAPVLALSGQVPSATMGRGAFQDLDLEAAFADVARYSSTVHSGSDHTELMNLACKTAIVEADVAHLVFPDEVQVQVSDAEASGPAGRTGRRDFPPPSESLAEAVELLANAERPFFLVGAGARQDMEQIIDLAQHIGAPVATTFKAKGQISDHHRLGCGVLGRSGTPVASWFMNESDLIVAFGASFSNHTGISPYKPIIQVDHDPMAIGRFHPVTVGLLGNVGVTAHSIAAAVPDGAWTDRTTEVAQRQSIWRAEKDSRLDDNRGNGLNSATIFAELTSALDPDAIISVDVGNNTYSFGRYFEVERQTVLMSGYLGSIGFGFAGAMGAWAANTGRQIISVSGDGGFGQYAMELTTAAKYGMNITHVLLNNDQLGKISKEQRSADLDVWQTSLQNPNFATFADNCGARGFRVEQADQLAPMLAEALAYDGPALIDIIADPELI